MNTLWNTPRFTLSSFSRCFLYSAIALAAYLLPQQTHAAPGDLYVSDLSAGTIFKFTTTGTRSTFASGIAGPAGLAFDRAGNLFVVERDTSAILKFTPTGDRSTFASGLSSPMVLAFDGRGNLFVSESSGDLGSIAKFTPAGAKTTFASGGNFLSLAFDTSGNLFAATGGPTDLEGGIVRFSPDGILHVFTSTGGPGIAFDAAGNFFYTDSSFILNDHQGVFASHVDNGALAFDSDGNLFQVDSVSGTILKFTPSATRTTFASGLNQPIYLAFEPITEKLRNISARGLVQTGENVLIAGLIVGGNALATNSVVIRAIGPSLSRAGISHPLQDPILELRNSSGALIASNDNWQDAQAAQITASGLAPTDTHESAILAMLPVGAYTAIVRGANDTTGVAVVEVYNLSK